MKNIFLFIPILIFGFQTYSQELIAETGLNFTAFEFTNSQGEKLENLQPKTTSYIELGYRHNVLHNTLFLYGGLGIKQYGAIGSDDTVGNYFEWDTSYLGLNFNADVKILKTNAFAVLLRAGTSVEFMLQGTQTLNNQVFNLTGEEEFKDSTLFLKGGIIFQYQISQNLGIFTQYTYAKSSENGNTQKLKFESNNIGIGLAISLGNSKTKKESEAENQENNI